MAGLAVNDRVQVSIWGLCFNQRIILSHWYKVTQVNGDPRTVTQDLLAIIAKLKDGGPADIVTPYLACLATQYIPQTIRVQKITTPRSAYQSANIAAGTPEGQDATVANDSAVLTLRTDRAGRSQISNKHIGPVPDAASAAGLVTNAWRAKLAVLGVALLSEVTFGETGSMVPVVPHPNGSADQLVGQIIGETSRVQRRRTVGIGV